MSLRWRFIIALAYLLGMVCGLYLSAVAIQGHAQTASPEVAAALNHAADSHGVTRRCLWNLAYRESRYLPWVDNYQGSGARGLMQFKDGTWRFMSWASGWGGWSVYDPWAAAHVAAWAIANPGPSQGGLRHWGGWC